MATGGQKENGCSLINVEGVTLENRQSTINSDKSPYYTGIVVCENMIFVIDDRENKVWLHGLQDGKLLDESERWELRPCGICVLNDTEIGVILSDGSIKIMSMDSTQNKRAVAPIRTLRIQGRLDRYDGAVSFKDDLIVCGVKTYRLYWYMVSRNDGHVVGTIHHVCKVKSYMSASSMATKDNILYISCSVGGDSPDTGVFGYDVQNPSKYKYRYKHKDLRTPRGIVVDPHGFLFVCNYGYPYPSIHHLTSECQIMSIFTQDIPRRLNAIFWYNGHLYLTCFHSNHITRYRTQYPDPIIPSEILNMDTRSIDMYRKALRDGKEKVYNIRVMVVGPYDVGKTTLTKRLLGKDVNIRDRHSTEGIDIQIECCNVSLTTGEWLIQEKDAEQDYQLQRLAKIFTEQQSLKDKVASEEQAESLPQGEITHSNASVTDNEQVMIPSQGEITINTHEGDLAVEDNDTEVLYRRSPQLEFNQNLSSTASEQENIPPNLVHRELTTPDKNTMAMLKLLQKKAAILKTDTGKNSRLTTWDFAGQFVFYTTHQTFLTRRAIYLLVSDVTGELTDIVPDGCYFDSEGIIKRKVYELIEVWLNSIHSCALPLEAGIPPVILVGTHVDEIKKTLKRRKSKGTVETTTDSSNTGAHSIPDEDHPETKRKLRFWQIMKKKRLKAERKKRYCQEVCERYFNAIRSHLSNKPARFHLVNEDFAIDNTIVDSRLEDLKRKIVEVASQQTYWGEEIPARWIPLEKELMRLKAAGIKVIHRTLLENLNQAEDVPIALEELDLFLRFYHDIGTILYFSTKELQDKIVLDPQWMIDAQKSLITAEMFVQKNAPNVQEKWNMFNMSGKLYTELIDAIWTKEKHPDLHDHKDHILLLMERLNIIAKPRCYTEDGSEIKRETYFLAPCMLKEMTPNEVMFPKPDPEMKSSSSVLCYNFVGKFLPSPIFHRLLATCVAHWPIAQRKSENQIFCGCCIFSLDLHHRLTVLFREYIIFARVTRMGATDKTPSSKLCFEVQEFITKTLTSIIGYLGQSLQFELSVQCPESIGYRVDCLIPVADLQGNVDVPCHFHDDSHVIRSHDVLKFWFQEEEPSDTGSYAGPMLSPPRSDTGRFMCIAYLLVDVGSKVLRQLLSHHTVTSTCTLDQFLANKVNNLGRVFNQSQMDIMFPPNGDDTNLDDYDITLLSALFQNIVPTLSQQEKDMIKNLQEERNKLYGHATSCQINANDFQTYWNDISTTLTNLSQQCGDTAFEAKILQEIQRTQVSVIPSGSYLDILKTWFGKIETLEGVLENVTSRLQALEAKGKSSETSAGPMPSPPTSDTDRFMCIAYLLVDVGSKVLRQLLSHHTVTSTCTLDQYLGKHKSTINRLTRVINQSQMDIMFPPNGDDTNLDDYDITLLSALFQNIVPSLSQQEKDMIKRLREERNKLYGHAKSCQINASDFWTFWNDISTTLTNLSQQCGDTVFEAKIIQEIQRTQVSVIPSGSYLDIHKTWFDKIETVEGVLQNVRSRLQALELKEKSSASDLTEERIHQLLSSESDLNDYMTNNSTEACIKTLMAEARKLSSKRSMKIILHFIVQQFTARFKDRLIQVWAGEDVIGTENVQTVLVCFYSGSCDISMESFYGLNVIYRDYNATDRESALARARELEIQNNLTIDCDLVNNAIKIHGESLFAKHSNLEAISSSGIISSKSRGFVEETCVILYCRLKGIIPFGEMLFPKSLKVNEEQSIAVDVREGYFSCHADAQNSVQANTFHHESRKLNEPLRMGCSIGRAGSCVSGTSGPFVKINSDRIGFLTCAHVVLRNSELIDLHNVEQTDLTGKEIVQPSDGDVSAYTYEDAHRLCGRVVSAVFLGDWISPTSDKFGIDAAVIEITSRAPDAGVFVSMEESQLDDAGFSLDQPPKFDDGKMMAYPLTRKIQRAVIKVGSETGMTRGLLRLTKGMVRYSLKAGNLQRANDNPEDLPIIMHGLMEISPASCTNNQFCTFGDSGAGVFLVDDENNNKLICIGLSFGNLNDGTGLATPIDKILTALNRDDSLEIKLKDFEH